MGKANKPGRAESRNKSGVEGRTRVAGESQLAVLATAGWAATWGRVGGGDE